MKKLPVYRYLGLNGVLDSLVDIGNVPHVLRYRLIADEGKILTDGTKAVKAIDIHEAELANWKEIDE